MGIPRNGEGRSELELLIEGARAVA